ncbi:DMT family transporter [Desulfonatronospira sp.]|uniref:DMT family transporter n=1 Tax=Desulfonatronospira sp. TaxID=1962951 RepID=UPI0025BE4486|nr:DMT family transporter [Desulfonatronospira sp.]
MTTHKTLIKTEYSRGIFLALTGAFVLSFDSLLIRLAMVDPWTVLFWRGLLMGLTLSLVFYRNCRKLPFWEIKIQGSAALASGILFGVTSTGFVISIINTHVANSVLIFSTAPMFAAIFTRFILKEEIRAGTWLAILAVMAGVAVVFKGSLGTGNLMGDLFALAAAVAVGGNYTILRRRPQIKRTAVVSLGGFATAALAFFWAAPLSPDLSSFMVLGLMGMVQMPLASVLLAVSTRKLSSPEVSLFLLLEAILGPFWVWLALRESPPAMTWLGGLIILITLTLYFAPSLRRDTEVKPAHRV